MNKGWINRLLSPGAEEPSSSAARESVSQLRVPTLDERISLYCRAVYERHDFGNEAYSDARNRILDAMAADIAIKAGINLQEEVEHLRPPQDANPDETGWQPDLLEYRLPSSARSLPSEPFVLNTPIEHSADYGAHTYSDAYAPPARARAALEFEDDVTVVQKIEPRRRSTLKSAMLAFSICAVAVIGGSMAFLLLRNSNSATIWSSIAPKSDKLDVAVQSLQKPSEAQLQATVQSLQKPSEAQLQAMQNEPTRGASVDASAVMSPSPSQVVTVPFLVKRGRELIAAGKIREARLLLKSAADAGDANAAFTLATTYDPTELEKLGARDADPDIATARAWYQKAKDLGSTAPGGVPQPSSR
jgi:TPR repeat protein